MKVSIFGKQLTVRESLKEMIEKKLMKFDKFFGEDCEANVTCRVRKGVKIIEITVNYGAATFRSEEESETFITALDRAIEGLERQIRKNKTRLEKRIRQGSIDDFVMQTPEIDEVEEEEYNVVRKKQVLVKPISVDEAILEMNMVNHDFFMFINAETDEVNVVYKRADGNYGVLEPATD